MLNKILETSKNVANSAKFVSINYEKADKLLLELKEFNNTHYLLNVLDDIANMDTRTIIDFLFVFHAIGFSFWGEPKWTVKISEKEYDGSMALLQSILKLFKDIEYKNIWDFLEDIELEEFKKILKGNVEIPMIIKRYNIIREVAGIVNNKMNGDIYTIIKDMQNDKAVLEFIINNFPSFKEERSYEGKTIYFYKLAQLLTSDILHIIEFKENKKLDYSNLVGCADYKIPQVMHLLGILEYSEELLNFIKNKVEIEENYKYEVEIRASMIVVIDYIWNKSGKVTDRIVINDYIWLKGQDKKLNFIPYHRTRTSSY